MEDHEPVYAIAVAARLTRMHPQTLRKYERAGLVRPVRLSGNQRLYSAADVRRLNRIRFLVEERGLNVAGLEMTLHMVDRLEQLHVASTPHDLRTAIRDVISMSADTQPAVGTAVRPRSSARAAKVVTA